MGLRLRWDSRGSATTTTNQQQQQSSSRSLSSIRSLSASEESDFGVGSGQNIEVPSLPTYLPTCMNLPTYLPTYVHGRPTPTYLCAMDLLHLNPSYLPTYLPTYSPMLLLLLLLLLPTLSPHRLKEVW